MIEIPKLLFLALVGFVIWYALRWLNRQPPRSAARQQTAPPRAQQRAVEDLVACRTCGTYVAAGAGCNRPDCPRSR